MSSNPISVIQQFLSPPLGLMTLETEPFGPFTGFTTHQRLRGPIGVDAFGIRYTIASSTPGYGSMTRGGLVQYGRRVITIQIVHKLLDGSFVIDQELESNLSTGFLIFTSAFPDHIDVICDPGIYTNLSWMLVL